MNSSAHRLRDVFSSFALLAAGNLIGQAIGFGVLVWVARRSSPSGLGAYNVDLALSTYASVIANFGVTYLAVRDIARAPTDRRRVFTQAYALISVPLVVAYLALALLASRILPSEQARLLPIVGLYVLCTTFAPDWLLLAIRRSRPVAVANLAGQIGYAIFIFSVGGTSNRLIRSYAWANSIGLAITAVILLTVALLAIRGGDPLRHGDLSPHELSDRARRSLPFGYFLLMLQVYGGIAIPLLGFVGSARLAGLYGVAYRIPLALVGLVNIWLKVFFPHGSAKFAEDQSSFRTDVERVLSVMIVVVLLLVSGSAIVASRFVPALFGPAYRAATVPFVVLIATSGLVMLQAITSNVLLTSGNERIYGRIITLVAAGLIGADFPLIHVLGATGAALGALAAEIGIVVATSVLARRALGGITLRRGVLTRGLACVLVMTLSGVALRYVSDSLVLEFAGLLAGLGLTVAATRLWQLI
jgi:PST family polysaccharide transporter